MSKKIKYLFLLFLLGLSQFCLAQSDQQQDSIRKHIDAFERIKMKDSLAVSDETITQVFMARDSMFANVEAIRLNSQLTIAEQDAQISALRMGLNHRIENLLGQVAYRHYVEMIRRNLKQRSGKTMLPLAGETAQ